MHDGACSGRPLRSGIARSTVAIAVSVGLILLAAACGGSPSSTGVGGPSNAGASEGSQLLSFAQCVRSKGVPTFPDPTNDNKFPSAEHLGVTPSRYQSAMNACRHLLPNGAKVSPSESQQDMSAMLRFARCMRAHGVPNWPDPTTGPDGKAAFDLLGLTGVETPQATTAEHACGHLIPASIGGIPVERS
jgi:hypothetical protein